MMRLIDTDALSKPIYAEDDNITGCGMTSDEMYGYNDGVDTAWGRIKRAPIVHAVEVVRCKNCKHFGYNLENDTYCGHRYGLTDPREDDFCSYGERRKYPDLSVGSVEGIGEKR